MLIFETRAAVQMALENSETTRRVLDGDELALARTHHDANGLLPRLLALIGSRLLAAWHPPVPALAPPK